MKSISDSQFKIMLQFVEAGGTIEKACKKIGVYRSILDNYPEMRRALKEAKSLTAKTVRTKKGGVGLNFDMINQRPNFEFQDFL